MKYQVTKFRSLKIALKELEPFIRSGEHLQTGKSFKQFGELRSRELLANWLLCAAVNPDRLTFTSDPLGGDGIIYDETTGETWPMEHVLVPTIRGKRPKNLETLILKAIKDKQHKGGAAYATGKTLLVFLNAGSGTAWNPTNVAKQLPKRLDFEATWVIGLQEVKLGSYIYNITRLDLSRGHPPVWRVCIDKDFNEWQVESIQ